MKTRKPFNSGKTVLPILMTATLPISVISQPDGSAGIQKRPNILWISTEGKLDGYQKSWMAPARPPEELFDVKKDPFQLHNLAYNPAFAGVREQYRRLQDDWTLGTHDMGHLNESEMIAQMWPGGIQPVTDKPYFIINSAEDRESKTSGREATFDIR